MSEQTPEPAIDLGEAFRKLGESCRVFGEYWTGVADAMAAGLSKFGADQMQIWAKSADALTAAFAKPPGDDSTV